MGRWSGRKSVSLHLAHLQRTVYRSCLGWKVPRGCLDESRGLRQVLEGDGESKCRALQCLFHGHS